MPGDEHVTVVVPLHNHEIWIRDALDSVDAQDHPDKSVVVVDDGSTDDSLKYVLAYTELFRESENSWHGVLPNATPVKILHFDKASGPSFARNRGVEAALATFSPAYIGFLDSDDLYEREKVSLSVEKFREMPGLVGAVYSDYDTLNPDGLRLRQYKEPYSRKRLLRECLVNCDSLVSAEALRAVGGFDESLRVCEDYDLWLRLSEKYLISHIPQSLVTVRVGEHSSTSRVRSEVWQSCYRRVFEKAAQRAGK